MSLQDKFLTQEATQQLKLKLLLKMNALAEQPFLVVHQPVHLKPLNFVMATNLNILENLLKRLLTMLTLKSKTLLLAWTHSTKLKLMKPWLNLTELTTKVALVQMQFWVFQSPLQRPLQNILVFHFTTMLVGLTQLFYLFQWWTYLMVESTQITLLTFKSLWLCLLVQKLLQKPFAWVLKCSIILNQF